MKHTLALLIFVVMAAGCGTYTASDSTGEPAALASQSALRPASTTPLLTPDAMPISPESGDALAGETIFHAGKNGAPACTNCHSLQTGTLSLGPVMIGISERAGSRIADISAHDYLHQSIVQPDAFIVPGFRKMMPPTYSEQLTEQDIEDVIAYLMTR